MFKLFSTFLFCFCIQSGFGQIMTTSDSSLVHPITQFLGARCHQIDSWTMPQDSVDVFSFSKFIDIYDFPIPVPYSTYLYNDLDAGIVKFTSGFAAEESISIPVSKYCNLATVFFDDEKPCFLLIEPIDSLLHIRFFQSCAVHY